MMTETGKLILKLTVLIVPTAIVLFTLYGGPKGNGGGGGGYDLSELVYSGLLTVFIFGWNIWVLVALSTAKTPAARLNNQLLLCIAIIALIVAAVWFFKQLR
jgi:Kef-type K+ transport system membrane component KefB